MSYVDGFVVAVPQKNIEAYKAFSATTGAVWKSYGAKEYVECIADDVPYGELTSFPRAVQAADDEVVIFSWIVYSSRQDRDDIMIPSMIAAIWRWLKTARLSSGVIVLTSA